MARTFNGTSDVITLAPTPWLGTAALSMSVWFNCTNVASGSIQGIFATRFSGAYIGVLLVQSSTVSFAFANSFVATSAAISNDVWYHVCGTGNSAATLVYLKGAQSGSAAGTPNTLQPNAVLIGKDPAQTFFPGTIADAAIWDGALSPVEIRALASGQLRPHQVRPYALKGFWPLDSYVHPARDFSGFNNHGVLTGTAFAPGPPLLNAAPIFPGISMPQSFQFIAPPPPIFVLMPQIVT